MEVKHIPVDIVLQEDRLQRTHIGHIIMMLLDHGHTLHEFIQISFAKIPTLEELECKCHYIHMDNDEVLTTACNMHTSTVGTMFANYIDYMARVANRKFYLTSYSYGGGNYAVRVYLSIHC